MREYPYPYPWRELPGSQDERAFLEQRFATMSVLEQYQMEGVGQLESIETAADLINITRQLYRFELRFAAVDEESLGKYVGKYEMRVTEQQAPFMDYTAIGKDYMARHDCVFTEQGCVVRERPCMHLYTGSNLADMMPDDPMRLKLASKECPEGVWLLLPDGEINGGPHEMTVALDALGVNTWNRTLVLDIRCCFDNIKDIAEQYDSVEALLADANNFSYIYEEAGQGAPCFRQHWQAAMELEGCTRLDHALDISQNLHCYAFIPTEPYWNKFGEQLARKQGVIKPETETGKYFDYSTYCQSVIKQLGLTAGEHGYIRRNQHEFLYEFSQQPDQHYGMEMKQ